MPSSIAVGTRAPEKLWSVTLTGQRLACELHPVGELAWEVHLYRDGWMLANRRFVVHIEALEFSAELRGGYQHLKRSLRPRVFRTAPLANPTHPICRQVAGMTRSAS